MLHTDLPIYKKGYDLLILAADVQLNMPRTFKQSLGKRVHDECVDLLLEIGYANASRGEKRCELLSSDKPDRRATAMDRSRPRIEGDENEFSRARDREIFNAPGRQSADRLRRLSKIAGVVGLHDRMGRRVERRLKIAPDLPVIVALSTPPTAKGFYGRLNPDWCEWLTGWRIKWTEFAPLETGKIRALQLRHGGY